MYLTMKVGLLFSTLHSLLPVCIVFGYQIESSIKVIENYVVGVDAGTESIRVGIFSSGGQVEGTGVVSYQSAFPRPGWAEQSPSDWWESIGIACNNAINSSGIPKEQIVSVCVDTTACSVVALDKNYKVLRPSLLWMDARSAPQTNEILLKGIGDPALHVNCNGEGPLSAEWMIPKALWIKQNEPDIWNRAAYICEKQDYFNFMLTDRLCASGCNVAARWHWDAEVACAAESGSTDGRPVSLLEKIDLKDLLEKWPKSCVPMGDYVGSLTNTAATHLGLCEGISVIQGGPDAYVGMIGLGCVEAGQLALITGSSHLHLCVGRERRYAAGVWGAYNGAPLPGLCFAEGGQSSTGSVMRWARRLLSGTDNDPVSYRKLDDEASKVAIGSAGIIGLETFQGSRTPVTDPLARGALIGLSLAHDRSHIWRALMESVCMGTRAALEAMYAAGYGTGAREILVSGGATRTPLWLQMHADVTGLEVVVGRSDNSPLLGAAILAAVGAGMFASVKEAAGSMVVLSDRVRPNPVAKLQYDKLFQVYKRLSPAIREVVHGIHSLNNPTSPATDTVSGPTDTTADMITSKVTAVASSYSNGATKPSTRHPATKSDNKSTAPSVITLKSGRQGFIVPSLLAADAAALGQELQTCLSAGSTWVHLDICDGGELCQKQLTFGPQTVAALHRLCPQALLDAHVVSADPASLVIPLAKAGVSRFTFQWESLDCPESALILAKSIRQEGLHCGVSISPYTHISVLSNLLEQRWLDGTLLIDLVDVLAVLPGVGGQSFNTTVLEKVSELYTLYPLLKNIAVDGGIKQETARLAACAGANVLIAGSSCFGNNRSVKDGEDIIKRRISILRDALIDVGR